MKFSIALLTLMLYVSRIADQFAANGYFVVMPDLFHGDPVPLNRPETYDLFAWLRGPPGHMPERVDPVVDAVLGSMRELYRCIRIGGVGYCFGAKYVVRHLETPGLLQAGYICTPSMVEASELRKITAPLSIAAAENDPVFPQEKRIESESILKDELLLPYQLTLYGRVEHGFGCKADINVPEKKFAKELAFLQALVWMNEYLKGRPMFQPIEGKVGA
jgi:dienelactone hydrolase